MGGVCAILFSLLWISPLLQQPDLTGYWVGVACFATSGLVELCAEPLWILAQLTQHVSIKVRTTGRQGVNRTLLKLLSYLLIQTVYSRNESVLVL